MTIALIVLLIIILVIIGFYFKVKSDIEMFSFSLFGTKNFFEGINRQKIEFESEPKTPYGMETLTVPELSKDFPYMNIDEMKKISEDNILNYLASIERKEVQKFSNPSDKIIKNLKNTISDYQKDNIKIDNINIHKTVVNKYEKGQSVCTLVFQSAIGYVFTRNDVSKRIEDRINTEYIYIFNDKHIKTNESISLHCPSCGAPIEGLGHKICPYCKAGLIDLAPKTWKLNDIKRIK